MLAPWYRPAHRSLAGLLPSVASGSHVKEVDNNWRIVPRSNTWASNRAKVLDPRTRVLSINRFRPLFDLDDTPPLETKIIRTIHARIRFVDLGDVHAKIVRRSFNTHGGAARFVWNAAVNYISKLPSDERSGAYNLGLLDNRFNTVKESIKKRKRDEEPGFVIGEFGKKHPWFLKVDSRVRQQALRDLVKAHKAGTAKNKAQRGRGEHSKPFMIKAKHKSKPSAWTFCLPSQAIKAEHVLPVGLRNKDQESPNMWTKLTLPKLFGNGKKMTVVYLTKKVDINDGKLLADARFCRDRLGNWSCVVHRTQVKPRARRPLDERKTVFLDPGSRTGQTAYSPDTGMTTKYMQGQGGVARLMDIGFRVDAVVREQKALPRRSDKVHREFMNASNKTKHRHQAKVKNLVWDAHRRVAKDLTSKYDTVVLPIFETQRMIRKPLNAKDPKRKLNSKAARALVTLSHFSFRMYLTHRCIVDGVEFHTPSEAYTTKACPFCGVCQNVGSSEIFRCPGCAYRGDRDEKAAFTYAVKCMKIPST